MSEFCSARKASSENYKFFPENASEFIKYIVIHVMAFHNKVHNDLKVLFYYISEKLSN
jgi:hypothetical protein